MAPKSKHSSFFGGYFDNKDKTITHKIIDFGPGQCSQWLQHHSVHQRVTGSILGRGHVPRLQVRSRAPGQGPVGGRQLMCLCHISVSPFSLSPPPPTFLPFSLRNQWKKYPRVRIYQKKLYTWYLSQILAFLSHPSSFHLLAFQAS